MGQIIIPKIKTIVVRQEGPRVIVIQGGVAMLDLPWEAAKDLARTIHFQASRAEQVSKVDQVISDQALLIRKGIPLALTGDPRVFKEAGKEAAHNRELRRAAPGGIPSGVKFGRARLVGKPSPKGGNHGS